MHSETSQGLHVLPCLVPTAVVSHKHKALESTRLQIASSTHTHCRGTLHGGGNVAPAPGVGKYGRVQVGRTLALAQRTVTHLRRICHHFFTVAEAHWRRALYWSNLDRLMNPRNAVCSPRAAMYFLRPTRCQCRAHTAQQATKHKHVGSTSAQEGWGHCRADVDKVARGTRRPCHIGGSQEGPGTAPAAGRASTHRVVTPGECLGGDGSLSQPSQQGPGLHSSNQSLNGNGNLSQDFNVPAHRVAPALGTISPAHNKRNDASGVGVGLGNRATPAAPAGRPYAPVQPGQL